MQLRDYQQQLVKDLYQQLKSVKRVLVSCPTGGGKCLGFDTPILMWDGSIKSVQEIKPGDLVTGDDSKPRKILNTCQGQEEMFRITPIKGSPFTCNKSHILTFVFNGNKGGINKQGKGWVYNRVYDISVDEYLDLPTSVKHCLKLYRVGVEYASQNVELDPYILGLWLSEGSSRGAEFTNPDMEVLQAICEYAALCNDNIREKKNTSGCPQLALSHKIHTGSYRNNKYSSCLRRFLRTNNLLQNKHIPLNYLVNSRDIRLKLLAGLLDGDGHLHHNFFEITQKSKKLSDNILQLARSLGFAAYVIEKPVNGVTYYRMNISGHVAEIPTRIPRKQAAPRQQIKDVARTGFKIESIGLGNYYGFETDGNHRFLLGDFMVTHNSLVIAKIASDALKRDRRTLIIVHRKKLVNQLQETIKAFCGHEAAIIAPGNKSDYSNPIQIAMVQTLARRELPDNIGLLVVDEAHSVSHFDVVSKCLDRYSPNGIWALSECFFVGLTATPWRTNTREGFCTLFQRSVKAPSPREMIKAGWLTNPRLFSYKCLDLASLEVDASGDYTVSSLAKVCNEEYSKDVVTKFKELCPEKKTIVFCATVAQAKNLNNLFITAGFKSEVITGSTKESDRNLIFERFKTGQTKLLISISTLCEGYDETSIEACIIARPTRSPALFLQMVGRALRLHPGKDEVYVIDFGECFDWLTGKKIGGKKVTDPIDLHHFSLCPTFKQRSAMEEKQCLNCQEFIPIFARVCPHCGTEIPVKKKEAPRIIAFPELEEIFTADGKKQYKFIRKALLDAFINSSNPMNIFNEFHAKFGYLPPKDWFLGAVFNLVEPFVSIPAYRYSLGQIRGLNSESIDFIIELEFGVKNRIYKLPNSQTYQRDSDYSETKFNPYDYLGIKSNSIKEQILEAYKQKSLQTTNARVINYVYEVLIKKPKIKT